MVLKYFCLLSVYYIMAAKFYKNEVKVGGARSECIERFLWGSGGLAPLKKLYVYVFYYPKLY